MRRCSLPLFLLLFAVSARAQQIPAEKPAPAQVVPTSGPRMEFLDEVSYYEQRFERLADAVPAEKYSWRPVEGVRNIGEVYMHVVTANYGFAKMLGTPYPTGLDPKVLVGSSNDKAKVIQALKDSFAHFRSAILTIKDSELDREIKTPRGQTTIRGAFFLIAGHYGEHLGQSIAYARSIGVVPPWTEERMRQETEKPKP
ncbi:MAG TPA: DinB family protein [Candidatus Eremiobacteraceae bacterium]|nr:DinB family protein [Candidatus Eremiobacteraceae bacterium]